jgi:hypothetical protein
MPIFGQKTGFRARNAGMNEIKSGMPRAVPNISTTIRGSEFKRIREKAGLSKTLMSCRRQGWMRLYKIFARWACYKMIYDKTPYLSNHTYAVSGNFLRLRN